MQEEKSRMNYCLTKQELDKRVAELEQNGVAISWRIMQILLSIDSIEELQELRAVLIREYVLKK